MFHDIALKKLEIFFSKKIMETNKKVYHTFNKLPSSLHSITKRVKCFEALYNNNHLECKKSYRDTIKKPEKSLFQVTDQSKNGSTLTHGPYSTNPPKFMTSDNSRRQMHQSKTNKITEFQNIGNTYRGEIKLSIPTTFFQIVVSVIQKKNSDCKIHLRNHVQLCRLLLVLANNHDIFLCPKDASTIFIWSSTATIENRLRKLAEKLDKETNCFFKINHCSVQVATKKIPNSFLARALFFWFGYVALDNNWIYTGDWLSILSPEPTISLIDGNCLSSSNKSSFGAIRLTLKNVFLVASPNSPDTTIASLSVEAILASMHISRFSPNNENLLPCPVYCLPKQSRGLAKELKKTSDYLIDDMEKDLVAYWKRQHGFNLPEYSHVVQVAFGSKTFCYPINVLWKERWVFQPFKSSTDTKLLSTFIGMTLQCNISLVPQPQKYSILQTLVTPIIVENTDQKHPDSQRTYSSTDYIVD